MDSLLTLSLSLSCSTIRKFLQDGDTVRMEGKCASGDVRIGFGDCVGKVLPAKPFTGL